MNDEREEAAGGIRPGNLWPYGALAALGMAALIAVPPSGEFPLNDDWIYAKVVQEWVESGRFQPSVYADPNFVLQGAWGWLWSLALGFSFETLRWSTLPLALVVVWSTVWLAREAGLGRAAAFLAGLAVLTNPLFLNLSYTFMTDIPYLAFATLAMAAYLRALRTRSVPMILVGSAAAAAALLIRQFAIVLPMAYAVARAFQWYASAEKRPHWREGLALAAPWGVAFLILPTVGAHGRGFSKVWDWGNYGGSVMERAVEMAQQSSIAALYLGAFLLPLAPLVVSGRGPSRRALVAVLALTGALLWMTSGNYYATRLPKAGNVLYDLGVGPMLMPGMVADGVIQAPVRLGGWWWVITGLAGISISLCVVAGAGHIRRAVEGRALLIALSLWIVVSVAAVTCVPGMRLMDRYFLMALPPLAVAALSVLSNSAGRGATVSAALGCLGLGIFSLVCVYDYLTWSDARWEAFHRLINETGIPPERINGGYEPNGWYLSERYEEESIETGEKVFGPKGWWIVRDDYAVGPVPLKRFETIGRVSYRVWLGGAQDMLIQRRVEADPF